VLIATRVACARGAYTPGHMHNASSESSSRAVCFQTRPHQEAPEQRRDDAGAPEPRRPAPLSPAALVGGGTSGAEAAARSCLRLRGPPRPYVTVALRPGQQACGLLVSQARRASTPTGLLETS